MVPAMTGAAGTVPGVYGPVKVVAAPTPRELFARIVIEYGSPFAKPLISKELAVGVILTQTLGSIE